MKQFDAFSKNTEKNLKKFEEILKKWQKSINLVSKNTLSDIWERHILDSAQLYALLPPDAWSVMDMGAGAGFPGLVLAILDADPANHALKKGCDLGGAKGQTQFFLVESDTRKGLFMKEVIRQLGLDNVTVYTSRIEEMPPLPIDVITARALKSLPELLDLAKPFVHSNTLCLFLKGEAARDEVAAVNPLLVTFDLKSYPSVSHEKGVVLALSHLKYGK